ncbi:hypothetical protein WN51_11103 [Melipona quadrifasciata]|uniref:Uncharacterized protein n=1 Tax=Melipona quadrifasciata TaxID=166423 RepID=A0A0M9A5A7_9HYME|nr:hypothetical protein WN51_11103 [Melipona quadrifasciata]
MLFLAYVTSKSQQVLDILTAKTANIRKFRYLVTHRLERINLTYQSLLTYHRVVSSRGPFTLRILAAASSLISINHKSINHHLENPDLPTRDFSHEQWMSNRGKRKKEKNGSANNGGGNGQGDSDGGKAAMVKEDFNLSQQLRDGGRDREDMPTKTTAADLAANPVDEATGEYHQTSRSIHHQFNYVIASGRQSFLQQHRQHAGYSAAPKIGAIGLRAGEKKDQIESCLGIFLTLREYTMAATKRNAAGLTSAVPRATLNDEELSTIVFSLIQMGSKCLLQRNVLLMLKL